MKTLEEFSAGQWALGRPGRGRVAGRVVLAVGVVSFAALRAFAGDWVVLQLTDNGDTDHVPQVSGSNVVWQGWDGSSYEVFLYDGSTTTQLTDSGYNDNAPEVSGSNVVWYGADGTDTEIFLYDGSTTTQLTDNAYGDWYPQVSGSNVVWQGWDGNDWEIFVYDGSTTTQLTDNGYNDLDPQVSGSNAVWRGWDGNDNEVFLYDGSTTTQLTDNGYDDLAPQVSGSNVVWVGYCGGGLGTIFLYDGSTTTQLGDNGCYDTHPQVSGSNVVWEGQDPSDYDSEIFLYNGSTTTQLTDTAYNDYDPQVSGSNVVWYYLGGNGVFLYDGSTTTELTDSGLDPQVSGSNVVWRDYDDSDYEIFLAVPTSDLSRLYVDAAATGAKDGSSWTDAFDDLRAALAMADISPSVTEIWVARGTYKPGLLRPTTFQLVSGVGVYGGFDGADSPNYPGGETLLEQRDPDPNTNGTILSGDIGTPGDPNDNSYNVVTGSGTDATAVLDGFTITGGMGNGDPGGDDDEGGGMVNIAGSPTVNGCKFVDNYADLGGAMRNDSGSNPTVTRCTFEDNESSTGAVSSEQSAGSYENCAFTNNTSTINGAGMNNSNSSPTVTNCLFAGNDANYVGGAICNTSSSDVTMVNCTFTGNSAVGAGSLYTEASTASATNCIFWGNTDGSGQGHGIGGVAPALSFCDAEDGVPAGEGNISTDPLFVDPNNDDYHLSPNSPCINAGDPNGDYIGQTDMDGEDRVLIGRVDMGADEASTTDLWYELTVTINNEGRGSVLVDPNDPNHPPYIFVVGTAVTLTGEPNEGASFNKWKMHDPLDANNDYTDTNNPTTLVMDRDWEVKAAFKCGSELGPMLPMILVGLGLFVVARRRA